MQKAGTAETQWGSGEEYQPGLLSPEAAVQQL